MNCGGELSPPYSIEEDTLYYHTCYNCNLAFIHQETINHFGDKSIDITVEVFGGGKLWI